MSFDLNAALLSWLVIAWSHRPFQTLFDSRGIRTLVFILDEAIVMLTACCWALPMATVMDLVSPKSVSPLPKAMLPLSTLAFQTETDPMLLISPLVEAFATSSLVVPAPVSIFMAHLSLSVAASAFAWFRCSTAVNTFDICCCGKTWNVINTRRHSTRANETLDTTESQSLTISCKSLSFLKPPFVLILALHFGHSAPQFRMLSFTQAPQKRWRHSGMACGSEKVSRKMEHSKLLSTKDVSLDKANARWSILEVLWAGN